jgi:hypothetical protein
MQDALRRGSARPFSSVATRKREVVAAWGLAMTQVFVDARHVMRRLVLSIERPDRVNAAEVAPRFLSPSPLVYMKQPCNCCNI